MSKTLPPFALYTGRGVTEMSAAVPMLYHQKRFATLSLGFFAWSSSQTFGASTTRFDCFQNCTSLRVRSYQPLPTMPCVDGVLPVR